MIVPRRLPWLAWLALLAAWPAGAAEEGRRTGLFAIAAEGRPRRPCWLYVPRSTEATKTYPLVVVLHPAGLRGSRFAKIWGEAAEQTGEFLVAAPECMDQEKRLWAFADEPQFLATVRKVISDYNVDPTRVLLTGFSQGGVYTYIFGLRNPQLFRAIAPVSGALLARPNPETRRILEQARHVPVYIAHGAADTRIPVERARAARDRLEKLGYTVHYRELPYHGHSYPHGESARIWAWFKALRPAGVREGKE
ncbi:MAG: prolyl oligopeptidase family serine peptidase [Candidatus Brocadiia bacterium]